VKILIFAHRLDVGGTQVNAIELAAALRDSHGHEISIFATPGPMLALAEEKRLRFLPAPEAADHPSIARIYRLRRVVEVERPDLIHVWDWPQCLDAYFGIYLPARVPMVVTSMAMVVNRELPKSVPTTFGTPELLEEAAASGRSRLKLIMPPVDVELNSPAAVDGRQFRVKHGFSDADLVLVCVSRLVEWMKAESLRLTIDAVRRLGRDLPLNLVIVGDGTSRGEIERLADQVNAELGRRAIRLVGAMIDPRAAYAGADIVVGMGGSALRGMAFEKPVIVLGERGFSAPFNPETANFFYHKGIYGLGDGPSGSDRLTADIAALAMAPDEFSALGRFGRDFVVKYYSLRVVAAELDQFIRESARIDTPLRNVILDGIRTSSVVFGQKLVARVRSPRFSAMAARRQA
jgi:Glycosyltransferase